MSIREHRCEWSAILTKARPRYRLVPDPGLKTSYSNPRLQARVLQARSETVSTLIAQIVRFARPNIQIYDAHVVDLYQWVCAR